LFAELQKAISDGNHEEVERIQRRILLGNRDESIDENFIKSIKGKTLGKNVSRIIDGKEFSDNDYMKIVSSLITHNIIESEQTGRPLKDYPIHELYVILGNFVNGGDGAVDECCRFVTERYSRFL
jgi:hypothetical protein